MGRLLVVLIVLVVGVAALGYSRGWFKVSTAETEKGRSINVAVDKEKIKADEQRVKEEVQGAAGQIKEKVKGVSDKAPKEAGAKESDDGRE